MALSDLTTMQFDEVVAKVAEVRPPSGGSGNDYGHNVGDILAREAHSVPARDLQTGTGSMEDVPFEITKAGARRIAALTPDQEYESLLKQHQDLGRKHFEGGLSRNEQLQLKLVDWMLDCVETARLGVNLDSLEQIAQAQELIAERVSRTAEHLESIIVEEAARHRYSKSA